MTDTQNRTQWSSVVFVVLAWLFAACLVVQVGIAGAAVFTDSTYWRQHEIFVHLFQVLPLLMLIFAFISPFAARLRWQSGGLLALVYAQYVTAHLPGAGALHPILAVALVALAIHVARRGWQCRAIARTAGAAADE